MTKININLNSNQYHQERRKYKNNKRFKVLEYDDKFTAKERNKFYIPKVITGTFVSIISLGLAPLCLKSIRELFSRKTIVCNRGCRSKSTSDISTVSKKYLHQPEHLFPDSQIPEDVINLVTNFLEPKEIAGLKRVNKDWHNYISTNKSFEVITAYIESALKKIFDDGLLLEKETAFIEMVAQYDLEKASMLVQAMEHKEEALFALMKVEAKSDLKRAKATIKKIQSKQLRRKAQNELSMIKSDLSNARLDSKLDKIEALVIEMSLNQGTPIDVIEDIKRTSERKNLELSKESAKKIPISAKRDQAFMKIVKTEAHIDVESAKQTVKAIEDHYLKETALIEIVKVEAKSDIQGAKETAQLIDYNSRNRDKAFLEIIKIEAESDLNNARLTVQEMSDYFLKNQACIEIIKAESKKDMIVQKKQCETCLILALIKIKLLKE